jgi:hypothetical protein
MAGRAYATTVWIGLMLLMLFMSDGERNAQFPALLGLSMLSWAHSSSWHANQSVSDCIQLRPVSDVPKGIASNRTSSQTHCSKTCMHGLRSNVAQL